MIEHRVNELRGTELEEEHVPFLRPGDLVDGPLKIIGDRLRKRRLRPHAIGPDLAGLSDRSAPYLVTHIIDPNRALEDKFVLFSAAITDGRTLAGMLTGEAGNSITLLGMDGVEQVILRNGLKSLTSTRRSLMPDGLAAAINHQAMADLVAFVAGAGAAPVK